MVGVTEALLASEDPAIRFFTRRDLLGEKRLDVRALWELPAAQRILRKQQADGSWLFGGARPGLTCGQDYTQLETYRRLGQLIELYGFDRRGQAIERAAEYLFRCQTSQGDFRGIYGSQYTPNYSAAFSELLVKARFAGDARLENSFEWLLYMRQQDGGWAIPMRTAGVSLTSEAMTRPPIEPVRGKPFSHLATGVVLRAFAAHPARRRSEPAQRAARLLASRVFARDPYRDRGDPSYWRKVSFPFWYTDAVSALDSLSRLGVPAGNCGVAKALAWVQSRRRSDGL